MTNVLVTRTVLLFKHTLRLSNSFHVNVTFVNWHSQVLMSSDAVCLISWCVAMSSPNYIILEIMLSTKTAVNFCMLCRKNCSTVYHKHTLHFPVLISSVDHIQYHESLKHLLMISDSKLNESSRWVMFHDSVFFFRGPWKTRLPY